jgi:hypothetical protein
MRLCTDERCGADKPSDGRAMTEADFEKLFSWPNGGGVPVSPNLTNFVQGSYMYRSTACDALSRHVTDRQVDKGSQ